jgi:hypothetical protein
MEQDKRKDVRFVAGEDVVVVLPDKISKIGRVIDIGQGGLAFELIDDEESRWEFSKRDISLWVKEFRVSDLPCKMVYDIPIQRPPEDEPAPFHIKTRRCGMQFENLTENQRGQLEFLLKTFTKGRI